MIKRGINFTPPPEIGSFWVLFDHFWNNGIGNELSVSGEPIAWNARTLAEALDDRPSSTALGQWYARDALPSKENIQRLCRVLLHEENHIRKKWANTLLAARREEELKRNAEKKSATHTGVSSMPDTQTPSGQSRGRKWIYLIGLLLILSAGFLFFGQTQKPAINISEIKFCTQDNFSDQTKTCNLSETFFPEGTQKVYVSFKTNNIPYGKPFSRRWYRNGEKWLERNDFFDETWKNFTWIHNENGHDHGEYAMRIIVEDQVFTGTFTLGE